MAPRRLYMPALLAERTETRNGRTWTVRVYQGAGKRDLLASGDGFRKRRPGAVLVAQELAR
jgi:hypothetical protein